MDWNIHIHHHFDDTSAVLTIVKSIERKIDMLKDDMDAAFAKLNTATTDAGTALRALADQAKNGLSAADGAPFVAQANAIADSLEAMAQSVTNPVPVPVPPTP